MVCRIQSVKSSYCISHRIWDRMQFEDGEEIVTVCLWEPYVSSTSLFLEETGSTNQDIISGDYDKRHIYTGKQTEGRGRHKRKWESMEKAYAGSWDISENESMPPGIVQLAAALAVVNALDDDQLSVKWPNDIMINRKKIAGILVESTSSSNKSKIVLGIGINIEEVTQSLILLILVYQRLVTMTYMIWTEFCILILQICSNYLKTFLLLE